MWLIFQIFGMDGGKIFDDPENGEKEGTIEKKGDLFSKILVLLIALGKGGGIP